MSSFQNPDVTTDPTETGVKHGAYPGKYLTRSGLAGVLRRMRKRGHTVDEPILRDAVGQSFSGPVNGTALRSRRTCPRCRKVFVPGTGNQKYCDATCQVEATRERARARKARAA